MPRQDDPTTSGDIHLLRRVPPAAEHAQWEGGRPIVTSQNFKDKDRELSVFIEEETTIDAVLAGHDGFGLIRFTAQQVRDLCGALIVICRDPLEDGPPGHALICGDTTKSMRRRWKDIAEWVRWPARLDPISGQPLVPDA